MIEGRRLMQDDLTHKYPEGIDFTVDEIKRGLRLFPK